MYNPDHQPASLKNWWKQYGKALIAGVVIGLLLLAGGNYWRQHKIKRAEAASLLYESLLADIQQGKVDAVSAAATKLTQDYAATPYAGKSALRWRVSGTTPGMLPARARISNGP